MTGGPNITTTMMELSSSSQQHRQLQTGNEWYDQIMFLDGARIPIYYNRAPNPAFAFVFGFIFLIIVVIQIRRRYGIIRKMIEEKHGVDENGLSRNMLRRVLMAALLDGGDPMYTIMTQTATNTLFLGGFQLNYDRTYLIMCLFYIGVSIMDVFRIFLTYKEFDSLRDFVVTAKSRSKGSNNKGVSFHNLMDTNKTTIEINAANVYQNMALNGLIVSLVFTAQVVLFTFVMIDTVRSQFVCVKLSSESLVEGLNANCPITGLAISYFLYILGILVQCVFLLGPGNDHGHPQMDPTYWTTVLLSVKTSNHTEFSWTKTKGLGMHGSRNEQCRTRRHDLRLWMRLFVSWIVNGFGFRVLLHSLPIQLASRKNLLQIIFQALGVIYVAKLDDAHGYKLTLTDTSDEVIKKNDDVVINEVIANLSDLKVGLLLENVYKNNNNIKDNDEDDNNSEIVNKMMHSSNSDDEDNNIKKNKDDDDDWEEKYENDANSAVHC